MAVTTSGVGSGIDIRGLVDDLLQNEGLAKTQKFDTDEASALSKITGFGTLKSALSEFQSSLTSLKDISSFQSRKANSSDSDVFTATATKESVPSNYSIEITQLATSHKLTSGDFGSSASTVGTGVLKFSFGGTEYSLDITSENQTLSGIRDRINETSGDTGVQASIVNVDSGSRLVLTSKGTGSDSVFTVSVESDGDGNDADNAGLSQLISANLTITTPADDALVEIDGALVTSSSNTIDGAIDGVTLDLVSANVGSPETLSVTLDQNAARTAVQSFVDKYNSVFDTLNELTRFSDAGPETVTGVLLGDSLLRSVESKIRREVNEALGTQVGFQTLAEIGITSNSKTGKLELSNTQLTQALSEDFDAIGVLFADEDNGIAVRLDNLLGDLVEQNGLIDNRIQGLNDSIADISESRVELERYLQQFEERMLGQLIAMDTLVAQLNSTGSFLTQQLDNFVDPLAFRK